MSERNRPEHVGRTVRREIRIEADPESVFEAWADPEKIAAWFVDRAEGRAEPGAIVNWIFDAFGYRIPIPVVDAVAGEYLAFGGEMPGRPPFLQEVILSQDGGHTVLRLLNSGFGEGAEWDEEYEGVDSGWRLALATLKRWLEHYAGRPRTHLIAMRPAALEYAGVQPLLRTADGLCSWLATAADLSSKTLDTGDRVALELRGGGQLSGEVLASSDRELLLSWDERDAVLGLKCFAQGPQRMVALDFNAWPLPAGDRQAVERWLSQAVDRLVPRVARSA